MQCQCVVCRHTSVCCITSYTSNNFCAIMTYTLGNFCANAKEFTLSLSPFCVKVFKIKLGNCSEIAMSLQLIAENCGIGLSI